MKKDAILNIVHEAWKSIAIENLAFVLQKTLPFVFFSRRYLRDDEACFCVLFCFWIIVVFISQFDVYIFAWIIMKTLCSLSRFSAYFSAREA